MSHTFTNKDGFSVCTHCGIIEEKTHYWSDDLTNEAFNRIENKQAGRYYNLSPPNQTFEWYWYNLLKINRRFSKDNSSYVNTEITYIFNQLPFSSEVKNKLHTYLRNKKLTSYKEVWDTIYKIICVLDLPLTTTDFLKILNTDRKRKKTFKPLTTHNESIRKYYWYISKSIEKARKIMGFSHEQGQELYKLVYNYYNLIRFRLLKSANPILLIQNLTYYAIRDKLKPNQQVFNKNNFGISSFCFISRLVGYLKEIKELKLDFTLSQKLSINARNIKLYSTLN